MPVQDRYFREALHGTIARAPWLRSDALSQMSITVFVTAFTAVIARRLQTR